MTLILTQINKYGIVFAADSNITINKKITKSGQKIFEIPKLEALLAIAGSYMVNKNFVSQWLKNFINNDNSKSLKEFSENLTLALDREMTEDEKRGGCIIHIGGFVKNNNSCHPEMWCVSNAILKDGDYEISKFHFSEDFWRRDWKDSKEIIKNSYGYRIYINGFSPGRIAFNIIGQHLNDFLSRYFWSPLARLPQLKEFRPPQNLNENEHLMRLFMQFIATMFELSNYDPKLIGGEIQSYKIKSPDPLWFTQ